LKSTRAQEEIVGFVVIVLLVAIVGVIFLGIYLRQDTPGTSESQDIYQFLESSMQYTTSCATNYEPDYSTLGVLIQQCHSGLSICTSGESPCDVANSLLNELIEASYSSVGPSSSLKGYEFTAIYSNNIDLEEEFIRITEGTCEGSLRGAEILNPAFPGTIVNTLILCS
jgi:hypothetical protein